METGIFYADLGTAMPGESDDARIIAAAEIGFQYVERDWQQLKNAPDAFFASLRRAGLGLAAFVFTDEHGVQPDGVPFAADLARVSALGIPAVMLVCAAYLPPERDLAALYHPVARTMNALCEEAERHGITLLAEDFGSDRIPCGSCEDLLRFGAAVPKLRFTADSGNFAYFGEDLLASYARIRGRVKHVHLKDHASLDRLETCVPGEGVLPIADFLRALRRDGYDGRITVELSGAAREGRAALARAAAFVRRTWDPPCGQDIP